MIACVLSHFCCVLLFVALWTIARQAPLVLGILQARILEWIAMPSSKRSSLPRTLNPCLLRVLHCRRIVLGFFGLHWVFVAACRIFSCGMWDLVPWPGPEPEPAPLGMWSLSHWTTRSWYGFSFCHLQLRVLTYNAQKFCSLFSGYLWTSWRNPSLKLYPWSSNMGPLFKAILPSVNMNSYPGKQCHKLFHLVAFVYLIDHIQLLQLRFNSNNHNIFIFIDIFILVLYLTTLGLERVNNIF